jgi:hypothetical protein
MAGPVMTRFLESPVWPFHANDQETVMEALPVRWTDR